MSKSLKFVQLTVRLEKPFGSQFFGTEDADGAGNRIQQPLVTLQTKDVLIEVLSKLVAALVAGENSIKVETDAGGNRIVRDETLINLNTASKKQLCELEGVGPATADKIIDHRPYKSVDEIATKIDSISPNLVKRIRSLVTITS